MHIKMKWIRLGLSLLGVGGVGLTSWLSVKCHEKAKDKEGKKDKIFAYAPAVGSGLVTAGCIMGAYGAGSKEIAALTASCGYLVSKKDRIEKLVKEKFGDSALKEIKSKEVKEAAKEKITVPVRACYEATGNGNQKFVFDEQGRYFLSSFSAVTKAEMKFNYDISKGDIPTWNDFYEYLGIHQTKEGNIHVIEDDSTYISEWNVDEPMLFKHQNMKETGTNEDVTVIYIDSLLIDVLEDNRHMVDRI